MTASPACTVVIPTYNRSALLRHTMDSLCRQRLDADDRFEVVVADDGSSDDTAEIVAGYRDRLDVRHFFHEDEGYRVAKARNVGIEQARSEVCVFVDSGVILQSGALARHLAAHRETSAPTAVVGYVLCFNEGNEDGDEITEAIDFADPDVSFAEFSERRSWPDIREDYYERYGEDLDALTAPWLMWWTCNASAPTALLREAGGFDEAYRSWGAEDVDLGYRLRTAGARFVLRRDAAAIHVPHPKSYEENMRSAAHNYQYFATKYDTPVARLVPDNHFHEIEDILRSRGLADGEVTDRFGTEIRPIDQADAERAAAGGPLGEQASVDAIKGEHMSPPLLGTWVWKDREARRDAPRVLVFSPHPDDEVIAVGGTIARLADEGARVGVVFATDGAMSHSAVLDIHCDPTPAELLLIRREEARAAAVALGLGKEAAWFLNYPDTQLAEHLPQFRKDVLDILRENGAVTDVYIPHEVKELNADHRLTGETVVSCLAELGLTPAVYRYVVWDERTEEEFGFVNRSPAADPGVVTERLVSVDISGYLPQKHAAFREHRTQVELYAPGQTRPVVPLPFQERVFAARTEEFWTTEPVGRTGTDEGK
ncbi:glycosyltransferase [Streptomyces sp. ISL-96]|uniref:PIG-L family deacetylase n=1 Tax=Streptomyces sp. ISL-96 TaxID=2819191 RepID=UPI001BE52776|nr:PIG-L family deacetylase [Streptomyces sp. ISL-96]MBT2489844.1 glycosyltransferase [Streptomyces sp. ISL-96]